MQRSAMIAILSAGALGAALGGCAPDLPAGPPEYLDAQVKQMSDDVFAVGIEARNVDEYAYARCVAANYAKYRQSAEFVQVESVPLRTRFFKTDEGKRVTYSYGVLQFSVVTTGKDAPPQVLSVRETLAECQQREIPIKFRAAAG